MGLKPQGVWIGLLLGFLFFVCKEPISSDQHSLLSAPSFFTVQPQQRLPLIEIEEILRQGTFVSETYAALNRNAELAPGQIKEILFERLEIKEKRFDRYRVQVDIGGKKPFEFILEVGFEPEAAWHLLKKLGLFKNYAQKRIFPKPGVFKETERLGMFSYQYFESISFDQLPDQTTKIGSVVQAWLKLAAILSDLEHYQYRLLHLDETDISFQKFGRRLSSMPTVIGFTEKKYVEAEFLFEYVQLFFKRVPRERPLFYLFDLILNAFGNEEGRDFLSHFYRVYHGKRETKGLSGMEQVLFNELGRFIRKEPPPYLSLNQIQNQISISL